MSDIACPECKGVGRIVLKSSSIAEAVTCPLCEGNGWVECKPGPKPAERTTGFDYKGLS